MNTSEIQIYFLFGWMMFVFVFCIVVLLGHDRKGNKKLKESFDAKEKECKMELQHIE